MKRYAIAHSEHGVFVGTHMGVCFFTLMETGTQPLAPTLPTKDEALTVISKMYGEESGFYFVVEVECHDDYVDALALRQAGVREAFLKPMIEAEAMRVRYLRSEGMVLQ